MYSAAQNQKLNMIIMNLQLVMDGQIFPRRILGSLILSKSGYTDLMSLFILELCLLPLLHL